MVRFSGKCPSLPITPLYVFSLGFLTATEHYNIYRSQIYFGVSIDICSFSSGEKTVVRFVSMA